MEITTEGLFNSLQNEKRTGEIVSLPKDFYKKAEEYLKEGLQGDDQRAANFKKLLTSLKERRVQKLLIYLAYNKQLPSQIPEEEEVLYNRIRSLLDGTGSSEEKIKRVRILSELPELMMPNGGKVGPFKQNQVIEVANANEVEFLLNNKLGEIV